MKFQSFSRTLPAIVALFRHACSQSPGSISRDLSYFFPKGPPHGEFHPVKNQRKARKDKRRRIAAGYNQ